MKNKKKLIAIIVGALLLIAIIVAAIFILFFSGDKEPSFQEVIENRVESYKTDLLDSAHQMQDQASVTKYLVNWAENKGIDVTTDQHNNVIYSFDATEGLEDRNPTVILCGYDYTCIDAYTNSIVCALTIARDESAHGEFKIIFVSEEAGNKESAHKLTSYFDEDCEVFYLGNDSSSKIANTSAGFVEYQFEKDLSNVSPSYNKAYKITISGIEQQKITSKTSSSPNPIKLLGNLLATFKSKSVLFDLVEFKGGGDNTLTPTEASITIVVSEDATAKVESRLEKAIESFNDKYLKKNPEATYTYEVVEMPYSVISSDDTESIISLLYTAPNGVYERDNDDIALAYSCITAIDVSNYHSTIAVVASGYDEDSLTAIGDSFETICALTDITFEEIRNYPIYMANEEGQSLANVFIEAYSEYRNTDLDVSVLPDYTMCSALLEDDPDMKLVALGVTNKTKDNFAGGLILHMGKQQ